MAKQNNIAISGGFDPLHGGHIDYIHAAAEFGNVVVLLNTDAWLIKKKGYAFMEWRERRKILMALLDVDEVVQAYDEDGTVCTNLEMMGDITYFGNGGDRTKSNTLESATCNKLGIKMVFGLGGNKTQSSSQLVTNAKGC